VKFVVPGLVIATALLTIVMHGCVPATQRMAAPLVCPSGTQESVVAAWQTQSGSNKSSAFSYLYCIDTDGGGYQPSTKKTIAVQFAYSGLAVFVVFFAARTVRRIRNKKVTS
jgi:hypothetical protein